MQITITARHFELTKAIHDYVETACLKVTKYFDHIIHMHVTLASKTTAHREVSMQASRFNLQSQAEAMDILIQTWLWKGSRRGSKSSKTV